MKLVHSVKVLSLSLLFSLSIVHGVVADDCEQDALVADSYAEEQLLDDQFMPKRGLLPVPDAVNLTPIAALTKLISPGDLGNTTKYLACCRVFQLTASKNYTPLTENVGSPMVVINGNGATFDLAHNCIAFNRSTTDPCSSHCTAIEIGYSPNSIGSNTQTDTVTVENGIICNWDIGIVVHAGVRNVILRDLVLVNNILPIAIMGQEGNEVVTVYLENVSIVGNCESRINCLEWVRSKMLPVDTGGGTQGYDYGGGAAFNPFGYGIDEVPQMQCNPESDILPVQTAEASTAGAYVYNGIYANYVTNMQMKNVSVSNIGFDMVDPNVASTAENTVAFGMYLRNCTTVFMEQMESTKIKSGLTAVGMYLDNDTVVSIKEANLSNNFVSPISGVATNEPGNTPANCKSGRWAAALVLKDCNVVDTCDLVLSKTGGIDHSWGTRVINNPVTRSNNFGFERATADFLRGDRVYGFDFGDLARADSSNAAIPPGAVHKLRMKNISISSARGVNIDTETNYPENDINVEFKGIYLGDGSKDIEIDGLRIESNHVLAAATGMSSGIEAGALSTTGTGGDGGTGKAVGTLQDTRLNDISISGNIGGGTGVGRFVGVRLVTTGTDGGLHTPALTDNIFENISISKAFINNNQLNGIRGIDDSGDSTPLQLKGFSFDGGAISSHTSGFGVVLEDVFNSLFKNCAINGNIEKGMYCNTVNGCTLEGVTINATSGEDVVTYGLHIETSANCLNVSNVEICDTESTESAVNNGQAVYGMWIQDVSNGDFKNVSIAHTTASGTGASNSIAYGMYFASSAATIPSVASLKMENISITATNSLVHRAGACFMNGAIGIDAHDINFSGSTTASLTEYGVGWQMQALADQGFELINVDGFSCSDNSGAASYGIWLQDPTGMTAGVRTLSSATFQKGRADNNISTVGVSYGIEFQENSTVTEVGPCDISFEDVSVSKNRAIDGGVVGLHIQRGESIKLHNIRANNNVSVLNTSTGPFTTHGVYLESSVDNLELFNVVCSSNEANNGNCTGLQVDKATVVHADGVIANDNIAEGATATNGNVAEVKGIFFQASVGSEQSAGCLMKNMQACGNSNAYRSYGIHLQEPTGVVMESIDASSNKSDADTTGHASAPILCQSIGLYLEGGCAVKIRDVHCSVNTESETDAADLAYNTDGVLSENTVNDTVLAARHFPVIQESGAYGILSNGTKALTIDGGSTNKNEGVRSFGILIKGSNNQVIQNIDASENKAIGGAWWDADPFNGLTNTAIVISPAQSPTLFGGATGTVDLKAAYEQFLRNLSTYQTSVLTGTTIDFCGDAGGTTAAYMNALLEVIWSTLAQYRRFSTAVGIGSYGCNCVTIDNCRTIGNNSEKDGAAGIAMYGCGNSGHVIQNCTAACNEGWTDSRRGGTTFDINGDMDITEWNLLFTFLEIGLYDGETIVGNPNPDTYDFAAIPNTITQATQIYGAKPTALDQPDGTGQGTQLWTLDQRRMTVGFPSTIPTTAEAVPLYDFCSALPLTAGILMEGQRDSTVTQNNTYSNMGNAGMAFGICSDAASTQMFLENKATSNAADALGYAWGLADISFSTPNAWFKNWMYANRVDVWLNSSLNIIFDVTLSSGQTLPLQVIQPGATEKLVNLLPLDNIVVEFLRCRQIEDCIADCVKEALATFSVITNGTTETINIFTNINETYYPDCASCAMI